MTRDEFRSFIRDATPQVLAECVAVFEDMADELHEHDAILARRVRDVGWAIDDVCDYVRSRVEN